MLAQVSQVIGRINDAIINPLIVLLVAAAFGYFLWGMYIFISNADAPEERQIGQRHMIWGIIGIVIMFAVNAIIAILRNTFQF